MLKKYVRKLKKLPKQEYWLTRFVLLRVLGFVWFFAFLSLALQVLPLVGNSGLLPADVFMEYAMSAYGSPLNGFLEQPSVFWLGVSDFWLSLLAWLGVALALVVLFGFANVPILFVLWALYLSFNLVMQQWHSFGWDMQILETTFLALFLVPLWDARPFPSMKTPPVIMWLFRWLAFRIYLGAGLIKIRADVCWRELTCLHYHYETQPIPGPLSKFFHFLPSWFHKFEVLMNHFVELVVPWFAFGTRMLRHTAGVLLIGFQGYLLLTGNLSFLNWLTIVPCIACFDDSFWKKILPAKLVLLSKDAAKKAKKPKRISWYSMSWVLFVVVLILSVPVVTNLFSSNQVMNGSFDRLRLVNTYGAFGSIGKIRTELVVKGTYDKLGPSTEWKEYEFWYKPTKIDSPLPVIAPYQPRVDWQIWFAAMSSYQRSPWMIHFVWGLLHDDDSSLYFIQENPFALNPPKYVIVERYQYRFVKEGVWEREFIDVWLPPLSKDNEELAAFIEANGWDS